MRVVLWASMLATLAAIALPPARPASAAAEDTCQSSSRRSGGRTKRRRGPRVTAAERRAIKRRHAKAPRAAIDRWLEESPPSLVLRRVNGGGEFILTPENDEGGFGDDDLSTAATALASREDGSEHAIHPRLLDLVYQAARRFRAPWVQVISGYRTGNATSRHAHGRAVDVVLPGTSDRRLAAWMRDLGFVGVGIYPTSGFVHLDVRERSYFWSDSSGPREENRERPMLREDWFRADREARRDGIEPTSDDVIREARAAERAAAAGDGEDGEGVELETGEGGEGDAGEGETGGGDEAAAGEAGEGDVGETVEIETADDDSHEVGDLPDAGVGAASS